MLPLEPGIGGLFATALLSFALGFFVYRRNPEGTMNRAWLSLSLATSVWALALGFMPRVSHLGLALWLARISQVAFSLIPAFFLRFSAALLSQDGRRERWIRWSLRVSGFFAWISLLTPLMVRGLQAEGAFRLYPVGGPFYGIFSAWFLALFLVSIWMQLTAYRVEVGTKRNQLRYVILASVVGMSSFLSMIPFAFGIPLAPVGEGLLIFYALIGYAIVRWRLMDISVVVENTLIYASLYSVFVGLFVVVVVFLGQLFFYGPQALDQRVLWMCLVALSIVTVVVRPLDAWLRNLTDRLLFQKRYQWQKTLKEASKGMTRVNSVDHLLKLMGHFIGMRVRVTHVGILHRCSDTYTLKVSRGREKRLVGLTVHRDNPLAVWLEEKKEVITRDEVSHWLLSEKLFPHRTVIRRTLVDIQKEMEHLGAHVCIPAFSKSKMHGFLVLGEKLSGGPYSQEDLDVLATLANEAAIALENAQLYEQLFERMNEIEGLYQREHRLFIHTAIALAAAVDARDPYTHGHTERCTAYAVSIAQEMGSHPEMLSMPRFNEMLNIAALLHDIGKIGVPDEILRKKAKLTPKEFGKMREHPTIGAIILQPIRGMEEVAKVIKAHHERYDGTGYPDGLKGAEIPLMTRIISIADTFDSMTTDRPYRRHLPEAEAIKEIEAHAGSQFDPMVVGAFLRAFRKGFIVNRPIEAAQMLG